MNGNFRPIIFMILLHGVMFHGCFKVIMGRKNMAGGTRLNKVVSQLIRLRRGGRINIITGCVKRGDKRIS